MMIFRVFARRNAMEIFPSAAQLSPPQQRIIDGVYLLLGRLAIGHLVHLLVAAIVRRAVVISRYSIVYGGARVVTATANFDHG